MKWAWTQKFVKKIPDILSVVLLVWSRGEAKKIT